MSVYGFFVSGLQIFQALNVHGENIFQTNWVKFNRIRFIIRRLSQQGLIECCDSGNFGLDYLGIEYEKPTQFFLLYRYFSSMEYDSVRVRGRLP